jgi:hypothetical protein
MELTTASLKKTPLINFARQAYYRYRFRGLMFGVWRYFENRGAKELYRSAEAQMTPNPLEQRVIRELKETGISMVQLDDLLPGGIFSEIQGWADRLIRAPEIQEKIKVIERGGRQIAEGGGSWAKSDKFYIVRPIGDFPVVDVQDIIMQVSLSEAVLRIVCGYLGMFSRLAAIDLWYNVATGGPDVFSQRWHRDPEDRVIVKTFLYLRDVDETNGPFCYVPGTHKPGALRQKIGRLNYPNDGVIERKFAPDRRRMCTGKAGTLIFCDTTGYHKGGHPTAGARFLVNAAYMSNASEPISMGFRQFSLKGAGGHFKSPAAGYAIGHALKR